MNRQKAIPTIRITATALLMALNIIMSSFGIPVPGGHLYLCDAIICMAAILLCPFDAFVVGGIGSFLGDMLFYPAPMFVSLVTHGLQAVVISVVAHNTLKDHPKLASGIGVSLGAVIMVTGYFLGKSFIYGTPQTAVLSLPYEAAQAILGGVLAMLLCWRYHLCAIFREATGIYQKTA